MTTREMLRQCADALESCGFDKKSAALRALAARWDAEITLAREMMTDDGHEFDVGSGALEALTRLDAPLQKEPR
jgi:hypothetical protein